MFQINRMSILTKIRKHGLSGSYRIVKNVLCKPIRPVIYSFFRLLPVKEDLIIFESEPDFCDNAWALYSYLQTKNKYRFVWVVVNPKQFQESRDTRFVSRSGAGLRVKSYYYFSRAAYIIFTHCTLPDFVRNGRQVLIYTSHGCAIKAGKGDGSLLFDYTLSLGENVNDAQSEFCGCDKKIIIPLGYPRNDILLRNVGRGMDNPFSTGRNNKVVLWMPTFRASVQTSLSENGCDTQTGLPLFAENEAINELNEFLKKNDLEIIIKIHHLQAKKPLFREHYSNIVFLTDEEIREAGLQLYEIVGKSDALITDYSSISFDYCLVDKPLCFILDDMSSYESDRGFVWDNVLRVMPGHHVFKREYLYGFLLEIKANVDRFSVIRNSVKRFVFNNADDRSCERFEVFFLSNSNLKG